MSLPATDVFTGATGTALTTYSASWSLNAGNFNIQANALASNGALGTTETAARWNADVFPNDQYAQAVFAAISGGAVNANIGVGVRIATDGSANYYGLYYDDDTNETTMFKVVAGVVTVLGATFSGARIVGDIIRLEIVGTTLTYRLNGTSQGTRTDASLASGSAGVVGRGLTPAQSIDNWEGGSLATVGGGAQPHYAPQVLRSKRRTRKGRTTQIKAKRQANPAVRPVKRPTVVKGRRRKPQRILKTTLIVAKRKGNIAHAPRVSPIVAKGRRRKPQRVLRVTQIKAKRQTNQAIKPVKQPLVVKGRRRRQRTLDSTILRAGKSAPSAPVSSTHAVPVLIVRSSKRRKRRLVSSVIVGAPRSTVPRRTKTIVLSKKRRPKLVSTQILTALLAQPATPRVGGKPLIVVQRPKRRKRQGDTTLLRAVVSANKAVRPQKVLKVVAGRKRRRRVGSVRQIKSPRQIPVSVSVKPSKTLFLVTVKKRKPRKTSIQKLSAKKSVVSVVGAPRAPLTVSLKRKHRKIQGKTTLLRAKRSGNQAIIPPRPPKIVAGRRRRRRTGDVLQIIGARRVVSVAPRRKPLIVRRPKARKQLSRKKTLILLRSLFSSPTVQFSAVITCYSCPAIQVVSKSGESIIVTSLSNDQTKLRAIQ